MRGFLAAEPHLNGFGSTKSANTMDKMRCDVSIIILTFNEERNIEHALLSVCGWAKRVFVFDSFSTDRTVEIARSYGCEVIQHPFESYGKQRNAALDRLAIDTEWVFFLDADEWLPPAFHEEVSRMVASRPRENGFYCKRRLIWMGSWIRRGYYPTWILRLFRHGKARCEDRSVNEHLVLHGEAGYLDADFIHEDRNGLGRWIEKHQKYAIREAEELLAGATQGTIKPNLLGTQAERKRWLREQMWNRLPPVVRPFGYFTYRYVLRGGVLDGLAGLSYHGLQGLWFPLLIDLRYLQLKHRRRAPSAP